MMEIDHEKRDHRLTEAIRKSAAEFLEQESNGKSIITITRVLLSKNKKKATIFLTVMPESYEEQVIQFAKRNMSEFLKYIRKKNKIFRLPFLDFQIDIGEKNHQRIEMLSAENRDNL